MLADIIKTTKSISEKSCSKQAATDNAAQQQPGKTLIKKEQPRKMEKMQQPLKQVTGKESKNL